MSEREERNINWVKEAFQLVNWSGNDRDLAQTLIKYIQTEHRTLVQSFFRVVYEVIKGYAQHEHFDARNEGSLKWAKEVAKIKGYFPLI